MGDGDGYCLDPPQPGAQAAKWTGRWHPGPRPQVSPGALGALRCVGGKVRCTPCDLHASPTETIPPPAPSQPQGRPPRPQTPESLLHFGVDLSPEPRLMHSDFQGWPRVVGAEH